MRRVCMISQSLHSDPRVRRQAEALADDGFEIDIICTAKNSSEEKVEKLGSITFYRVIVERKYEDVLRYVLQYFLFFISAFFKLQYLSLIKSYNLIQIHNMPEFHVFTAVFQKLAGVPIVLDIHDLTPELFECKWQNKKRPSLIALIRFMERISCRFADKIITVNEICKQYLVGRGIPPEKITLILNTPNQKIFKYDDEREFRKITSGARLIYHGTVAQRFGLHTAVEAMKLLNEKIPESQLFIYGRFDLSYKKSLDNLIAKYNLEGNVFLQGEHPQEVIYNFIKLSDFGIVSYVDNEYMNLCLSTKMFEYNASLLPVVASRLKAFSMIFNDDSIAYIEPDNSKALAEKLVQLCYDPDKRKTMICHAYSVLQTISGQIMSVRYLNLINSTILEKKSISVSTSGI
jgi:glycosyltransferase involved in cell wall biosynthesis